MGERRRTSQRGTQLAPQTLLSCFNIGARAQRLLSDAGVYVSRDDACAVDAHGGESAIVAISWQ